MPPNRFPGDDNFLASIGPSLGFSINSAKEVRKLFFGHRFAGQEAGTLHLAIREEL